jgi:cytochrome c oxidase subunit 4
MTSVPDKAHAPHAHGDHGGHPDHGDPLMAYLVVFVALMVLLVLTLVVYTIPFEKIANGQFAFMNTFIALLIASTKALLVMLVFMHLRHSTKLTWVIAGAGFVWLCIMISFTFADYMSRGAIHESMTQPLDRQVIHVPEH